MTRYEKLQTVTILLFFRWDENSGFTQREINQQYIVSFCNKLQKIPFTRTWCGRRRFSHAHPSKALHLDDNISLIWFEKCRHFFPFFFRKQSRHPSSYQYAGKAITFTKFPPLVFLGGACNPTTWRKDRAIPFLSQAQISFFNPVSTYQENPSYTVLA